MLTVDIYEFDKVWKKLRAKARSDWEFKDRLLSHPADVFEENGLELPEGLGIGIEVDTDGTMQLILPPDS